MKSITWLDWECVSYTRRYCWPRGKSSSQCPHMQLQSETLSHHPPQFPSNACLALESDPPGWLRIWTHMHTLNPPGSVHLLSPQAVVVYSTWWKHCHLKPLHLLAVPHLHKKWWNHLQRWTGKGGQCPPGGRRMFLHRYGKGKRLNEITVKRCW